MSNDSKYTLGPIYIVNFFGTLGFSIVFPFLVLLNFMVEAPSVFDALRRDSDSRKRSNKYSRLQILQARGQGISVLFVLST